MATLVVPQSSRAACRVRSIIAASRSTAFPVASASNIAQLGPEFTAASARW